MDSIFSIILLAFFTAVFTAFFLHIIFTYHGYKLLAKLQDALEDYEDEEEGELVDAYIEKTETYLLLYRKDNNTFIAQGSSWAELNVNAVKMHPNVRYSVTPEDIKMAQEFKS
jgi:hypothetical protein